MANVEKLITENLDTWSSAIKAKSSAGRGGGKKQELYGIKRLRELILELAVRGLLVAQDPNEEPASELLNRAAKEKEILIKGGEIKRKKVQPEIDEHEKPFSLPSGWAWIRLSEAGHDWGQKKPDSNFTYIDVGSINKEHGLVRDPDVLSPKKAPSRARKIVKKGTVIYSTVRPYLLNIAVVSESFSPEPIASTAFAIIHPFQGILAPFIYRYLRSPTFINYVESCQTGIAYPAINDKQFFSGVLPIPPLAEQHRIVAKVDELMALCDRLEQQQEDSLRTHDTLVQTLLGAVTAASKRGQFAQAWKRIESNFDTLFTTESSIDQLKQTILQLAVMGKLVEQDPEDEPAGSFLNQIAEKNINKKALPKPKRTPYTVPESWEWSTSGYIGEIKLGRQRSPKDHNGPNMVPYLRVANVHDNRLALSDVKEMNFTPDEQKIFRLKAGDILLNEGQSRELVGRPALYREEIPGCCFQNTLLRLRVHEGVYPEYALLYFRSCLYSGRFQKAVKQTTNMAHLSAGRLSPIEFPLPPLAEQHRIVAKVDELMALCDQLEASLATAQATQLNLADSLVEAAIH
ncbi:MAG: restriction endonuclease subunit S [Verrucomicrobiales bacterium]|nr:restriction endonuclease subunit S [Verrucomicrobiales bacterium]